MIPDKALSQHIIILGKTRSGKSSVMRLIVERLLDQAKPVCVIDPKGDWWGLKSSASGKEAGYPVIIFGGSHADVPINQHSAGYVAELVATGNRPCIIDLGGWMVGERTRFFIDFASALFRHTRGPRWLCIDEVHNFAPQGKILDPDAGKMLHWANRLASEGAGKGLTLISASQRPQKVHKDFVTSNETLIAMRVIHELDRRAMKEWIDGCADPAMGKEVLNTLAGMQRGEGWVWSPEIGFGPKRIQFPMFKTYDSFKAPTSESIAKLTGWATVDLEEVKAKLAKVVDEAKANDPKELRAKIARLEAELKKKQAESGPPDPAAIKQVEADAFNRGYEAGRHRAFNEAMRCVEAASAKIDSLAAIEQHEQPKKVASASPMALRRQSPHPTTRSAPERVAPVSAKPRADFGLSGPQQRILNAIAWWRSVAQKPSPKRVQVAFLAGYTPGTGTFNCYLSELSSAGLISYPQPGLVALTDEGIAKAYAEEVAYADVHDAVRAILSGPQKKLFEALIAAYPDQLTREKLAAKSGYTAGTGTFNAYVSELSSLEIAEYPERGAVRAADWLFDVGAS